MNKWTSQMVLHFLWNHYYSTNISYLMLMQMTVPQSILKMWNVKTESCLFVLHRSSNDLPHSSVCLQHLSTFVMDKSESIATVDDAIKKLKLLDSKDKIWTQEMLLQVTEKSIKLLDCETKVSGIFSCVLTSKKLTFVKSI